MLKTLPREFEDEISPPAVRLSLVHGNAGPKLFEKHRVHVAVEVVEPAARTFVAKVQLVRGALKERAKWGTKYLALNASHCLHPALSNTSELVALPGEFFVETGREIRRRLGLALIYPLALVGLTYLSFSVLAGFLVGQESRLLLLHKGLR